MAPVKKIVMDEFIWHLYSGLSLLLYFEKIAGLQNIALSLSLLFPNIKSTHSQRVFMLKIARKKILTSKSRLFAVKNKIYKQQENTTEKSVPDKAENQIKRVCLSGSFAHTSYTLLKVLPFLSLLNL